MLTDRWERLRPHPVQLAYRSSPHRFNVIPAGRRSGKTERFKRKLVQRALRGTQFFPARFFAAAPTRDQAKRIYWDDLKALVPSALTVDVRETELMLRLPLSEIWVVGLDKPQRIEGQPWDGGGLDEYADMKPEAWTRHVRPALSDRQGWCDFLGVPEGRNHYYDLYEAARAEMMARQGESDWGAYTWPSSDILPPEEIEAARRDLDELTFAQEFEASFVNFSGRAYYGFRGDPWEQGGNLAILAYDPRASLVFCFDFNVDPGVAVVCQEMELANGSSGTGVIGEVWVPRNSNTPVVVRKLLHDWGEHAGPVTCYGDATGGARGSAQVEGSDWDLIKRDMTAHFRSRASFKVSASNPAERARVNAMNTRLRSAEGSVRLLVDPKKAPHLVRDLEGVRVLAGGSGELDKKRDLQLTHPSDALGYYVESEYPVRTRGQVTVIESPFG